jgi:hypothetical protein
MSQSETTLSPTATHQAGAPHSEGPTPTFRTINDLQILSVEPIDCRLDRQILFVDVHTNHPDYPVACLMAIPEGAKYRWSSDVKIWDATGKPTSIECIEKGTWVAANGVKNIVEECFQQPSEQEEGDDLMDCVLHPSEEEK